LAKARKMVNLSIEETSGVDHPAHLTEGWLVMKSADESDVQRVLDESLNREDSPMEETVNEQTEETPKDEATVEASAETEVEASSDEEVLKSAPEAVIKMVEDLRKAKEYAESKANEAMIELQKQRDAKADAEAIEKAKAWSHLNLDAEFVGKSLRQLNSVDTKLAKSVEDILTSVNAQAESANIFAEIGSTINAAPDNAYGRMTIMAKSLVDSGQASSVEAGIAQVAVQNPELYSQYLNEKGA
jgi:hypothetical protein